MAIKTRLTTSGHGGRPYISPFVAKTVFIGVIVPGLEYTFRRRKPLHYTLKEARPHYTLDPSRLHYTLPNQNGN